MGLFVNLSCIFAIGCSLGWMIEVIFRRFISGNNPDKRWINPGFLKGPWLPLYGIGLSIIYIIALAERNFAFDDWLSRISLILFMSISMTVIEYLSGLFSLNVLKVRLWDYSNEKNNLQGLICLRFSIFWALLGAAYYLFIHNIIENALLFATHNDIALLILGVYIGIFIVDAVYYTQAAIKASKIPDELSSRL